MMSSPGSSCKIRPVTRGWRKRVTSRPWTSRAQVRSRLVSCSLLDLGTDPVVSFRARWPTRPFLGRTVPLSHGKPLISQFRHRKSRCGTKPVISDWSSLEVYHEDVTNVIFDRIFKMTVSSTVSSYLRRILNFHLRIVQRPYSSTVSSCSDRTAPYLPPYLRIFRRYIRYGTCSRRHYSQRPLPLLYLIYFTDT